MYFPEIHTEAEGYARYVEQQMASLHAAALGLTDEQARLTPLRSALSIGGILKHVTYVFAKHVGHAAEEQPLEEGYAAFMDSFALRDDETLAGTLADFEDLRPRLLEHIRGTDPDEVRDMPPAPWYGLTESRQAKARYTIVHVIEELARHAGHADIIREQIDGATSPELVLAEEGQNGNEYVESWTTSA